MLRLARSCPSPPSIVLWADFEGVGVDRVEYTTMNRSASNHFLVCLGGVLLVDSEVGRCEEVAVGYHQAGDIHRKFRHLFSDVVKEGCTFPSSDDHYCVWVDSS